MPLPRYTSPSTMILPSGCSAAARVTGPALRSVLVSPAEPNDVSRTPSGVKRASRKSDGGRTYVLVSLVCWNSVATVTIAPLACTSSANAPPGSTWDEGIPVAPPVPNAGSTAPAALRRDTQIAPASAYAPTMIDPSALGLMATLDLS